MGALFVDDRSFQTVDSTLRQPGRLLSSMWHVVGVCSTYTRSSSLRAEKRTPVKTEAGHVPQS